MASRRIFQSSALRPLCCSPLRSRVLATTSTLHKLHKTRPAIRRTQIALQRSRFYSTAAPHTVKYSFEDIKPLTNSPSSAHILIDVREPHEYAAGHIPTALNMPIVSHPEALFMPDDEFLERFGFAKPPTSGGAEVIFYCKSGVRSRTAAALALQTGFERVAEYQGSWGDWIEKGGRVEQ